MFRFTQSSLNRTPLYRAQVGRSVNQFLSRQVDGLVTITNCGSACQLFLVPLSCREAYWGVESERGLCLSLEKKPETYLKGLAQCIVGENYVFP